MSDYKNTMLISPDTIKGIGDLNYNVDDSIIGAAIRTAQNVYLEDVIGTALLNKLQELVYNAIVGNEGTIDDEENEAYKILLDEYVTEALQYKTVAELCVRISLKVRNAGVTKNSDTNMNAASLSEIKYIRNTYETYYCDALNRMIEYLIENRKSIAELDDCSCGKKKPKLNKYANTGIYLGT